MKTEVNPANKLGRIVIHVAPSGRKIEVRVSAHIDLNHPEKIEPATVSWHAIGSVSPDDADAYAETIQHAARVARKLDKDNEGGP